MEPEESLTVSQILHQVQKEAREYLEIYNKNIVFKKIWLYRQGLMLIYYSNHLKNVFFLFWRQLREVKQNENKSSLEHRIYHS